MYCCCGRATLQNLEYTKLQDYEDYTHILLTITFYIMAEWKHTSYPALSSIRIRRFASEASRYHLPDDFWEGIVTTSSLYAEINLNEY